MTRPNPTCFHRQCLDPRVYSYTCAGHAYQLVATEESAAKFTTDSIGHYLLGHLAG